MIGVIIVVGIAILVVLVIGAAKMYEKQRMMAVATVSESLGLDYKPTVDQSFLDLFPGFHVFEQGHARRLTNMIIGETDDVSIAIFDFQFTLGSGKDASTWKQTVAALSSPELNLPRFILRPESLLGRMIQSIGVKEVKFKTNPEFSKMFRLLTTMEEETVKFFDESTLSYFEKKPRIYLEADGNALAIYYSAKRVTPEEIKPFLADAYEIYGMMVEKCQKVN